MRPDQLSAAVEQRQFDFQHFIADGGADGRSRLAQTMRELTGPRVTAAGIDVRSLPDAVLLEPRLIGWHFGPAQPMVSIFQLLLPGLGELAAQGIPVRSDEEGAIPLPGYGTVLTNRPSTDFFLNLKQREQEEIGLRDAGGVVEFELRRDMYVPGTRIEIVERIDPVLKGFLSQHITGHEGISICSTGHEPPPALCRALDLISRHAPSSFDALTRSVRSIFLFNHPSLNSFAALQMHGMLFLNLSRAPTVPFFVDGLVHQGGHVVFSEATLQRQLYFIVDPDTRLGAVTSRKDERTVYEALHGLYTECALLEVFRKLEAADVSAREALELEARFAFVLTRFGADLKLIDACAKTIFTPEGMAILDHFQKIFSHFEQSPRAGLFDWTGQAEEFDFQQFTKRNGGMQIPAIGQYATQ